MTLKTKIFTSFLYVICMLAFFLRLKCAHEEHLPPISEAPKVKLEEAREKAVKEEKQAAERKLKEEERERAVKKKEQAAHEIQAHKEEAAKQAERAATKAHSEAEVREATEGIKKLRADIERQGASAALRSVGATEHATGEVLTKWFSSDPESFIGLLSANHGALLNAMTPEQVHTIFKESHAVLGAHGGPQLTLLETAGSVLEANRTHPEMLQKNLAIARLTTDLLRQLSSRGSILEVLELRKLGTAVGQVAQFVSGLSHLPGQGAAARERDGIVQDFANIMLFAVEPVAEAARFSRGQRTTKTDLQELLVQNLTPEIFVQPAFRHMLSDAEGNDLRRILITLAFHPYSQHVLIKKVGEAVVASDDSVLFAAVTNILILTAPSSESRFFDADSRHWAALLHHWQNAVGTYASERIEKISKRPAGEIEAKAWQVAPKELVGLFLGNPEAFMNAFENISRRVPTDELLGPARLLLHGTAIELNHMIGIEALPIARRVADIFSMLYQVSGGDLGLPTIQTLRLTQDGTNSIHHAAQSLAGFVSTISGSHEKAVADLSEHIAEQFAHVMSSITEWTRPRRPGHLERGIAPGSGVDKMSHLQSILAGDITPEIVTRKPFWDMLSDRDADYFAHIMTAIPAHEHVAFIDKIGKAIDLSPGDNPEARLKQQEARIQAMEANLTSLSLMISATFTRENFNQVENAWKAYLERREQAAIPSAPPVVEEAQKKQEEQKAKHATAVVEIPEAPLVEPAIPPAPPLPSELATEPVIPPAPPLTPEPEEKKKEKEAKQKEQAIAAAELRKVVASPEHLQAASPDAIGKWVREDPNTFIGVFGAPDGALLGAMNSGQVDAVRYALLGTPNAPDLLPAAAAAVRSAAKEIVPTSSTATLMKGTALTALALELLRLFYERPRPSERVEKEHQEPEHTGDGGADSATASVAQFLSATRCAQTTPEVDSQMNLILERLLAMMRARCKKTGEKPG